MNTARLRNTGRFKRVQTAVPDEITPNSTAEIVKLLSTSSRTAKPIRPQGAATSSTDCNACETGTVLRLSGLNRILHIDTVNHTITAQAGVRLYQLVEALAEQGLELAGNHELAGRTLGGAIGTPCFGPGIGKRGESLASQVISVKLIAAGGRPMQVSPQQKDLMGAIRMSYGTLGVITEATLRVQPMRTFSVSHRKLDIETFCSVVDTLANSDVGFKFYLLPHRDRVYLDLRRYAGKVRNAHSTPWKIKDWGETTVLPNVFKSLNRLLPVHAVRYPLIDVVSEATQGLANSPFLSSGNNATAGQHGRHLSNTRNLLYSTWCFPATDFSIVTKAYRDFCCNIYAESRYRCDMPAIGYRVCRDARALLSPAFDEPMIALQTASTASRGWEDFVIDLADFAEQWGGVPIFSQSRSVRPDYARSVYGPRLEVFRRIRQRLDPENQLLNPFLAQYFG